MNILPKKEGQIMEFKASFGEVVIETLVAFSNARGGKVYIGVSDKGKVQGITIGKESAQNWINEVKGKTSPQIIPSTEILEIEKKTVLVLSVPEYPIKPVSTRGKYYKRVANSNHLLSIDEIVNEHLRTINSSWDMFPNSTYSLDEISLEKVQKSMDLMRNNGITINESPIQFLSKYNLLRDDKLTNAAYLLFKKNDCVITTIELGRFQNPITIKDSARTKSDILAQVDEVINYVKKHINLEVIITGNPQSTQKWQYPMEAIREIVLNMIIHRDYRSSSDSIVKIFNDKIEFYNPGRLPDNISVEDLLSNNYISIPRNKKIAEFFKDLSLIEKYGSGIQRIVNYFKAENLPVPEFKNISDGFMVTVFMGVEKLPENYQKTTRKLPENDMEEKILNILKSNPKTSRSALSKQLKISMDLTKYYLDKLKKRKLIQRKGPDKGGYWKIYDMEV